MMVLQNSVFPPEIKCLKLAFIINALVVLGHTNVSRIIKSLAIFYSLNSTKHSIPLRYGVSNFNFYSPVKSAAT